MTVALASPWNPRGELTRFQRLHPLLQSVYSDMIITLPPQADEEAVKTLESLPHVRAVVTTEWQHGRYLSLKTALETGADHIHYADFDRLLRWVETRPDEWRQTAQVVVLSDCLVIGRTQRAWDTHPHALRETEAVSNGVFSHLLGIPLDLSAGSKGFSRAAAQVLVANTRPDRPMGADSEWIVLLHRAGFAIETVQVNGLDWESADRYRSTAADGHAQREAAAQYDLDPQHWAMRVAVAAEIVEAGLDALRRELVEA
jgi:hypothetical protein